MRSKTQLIVLILLMLVTAACASEEPEATVAPAGKPFEGQTLRVGIFSEGCADQFMEGFGDQFEQDTGAKVEWIVAATDVNVSKILADPSNPEFDTMIVSNHDVWPLQDAGLVVSPNYDAMVNIDNLDPVARMSTGPGLWYYEQGICYNTEKFEEANIEPPDSIEDLFDPRFAERIALPLDGFFNAFNTPIAEHFGFPTDDPGPFMEKFSDLEPYAFYASNTDATNLWQSGDVWLGVFSSRCLDWKYEGLPFEMVPLNLQIGGETYGYYGYVTAMSNIKGGNFELGEIFMDYAISENGLGPRVRSRHITPTVISVRNQLLADPDIAPLIRVNPAEEIYLADYANFWQNKADWVNAWNRLFH